MLRQSEIKNLESKFIKSIEELEKRVSKIEVIFVKIDPFEFLVKHNVWVRLPEAYGHNIKSKGIKTNDGSVKMENKIKSGGYMLPHFHEARNEKCEVQSGEITYKIYNRQMELVETIKLHKGDSYVIKRGLVHGVESEIGCQCTVTWF